MKYNSREKVLKLWPNSCWFTCDRIWLRHNDIFRFCYTGMANCVLLAACLREANLNIVALPIEAVTLFRWQTCTHVHTVMFVKWVWSWVTSLQEVWNYYMSTFKKHCSSVLRHVCNSLSVVWNYNMCTFYKKKTVYYPHCRKKNWITGL